MQTRLRWTFFLLALPLTLLLVPLITGVGGPGAGVVVAVTGLLLLAALWPQRMGPQRKRRGVSGRDGAGAGSGADAGGAGDGGGGCGGE